MIGTDSEDESFGEELGELADLTVNNEADQNNYDVSMIANLNKQEGNVTGSKYRACP